MYFLLALFKKICYILSINSAAVQYKLIKRNTMKTIQTLTMSTNKRAMYLDGTNYIKVNELGVTSLPTEFEVPVPHMPYIMHVTSLKTSKSFIVRTLDQGRCILKEKLTAMQFIDFLKTC